MARDPATALFIALFAVIVIAAAIVGAVLNGGSPW